MKILSRAALAAILGMSLLTVGCPVPRCDGTSGPQSCVSPEVTYLVAGECAACCVPPGQSCQGDSRGQGGLLRGQEPGVFRPRPSER
jgi:hypothetical protein